MQLRQQQNKPETFPVSTKKRDPPCEVTELSHEAKNEISPKRVKTHEDRRSSPEKMKEPGGILFNIAEWTVLQSTLSKWMVQFGDTAPAPIHAELIWQYAKSLLLRRHLEQLYQLMRFLVLYASSYS